MFGMRRKLFSHDADAGREGGIQSQVVTQMSTEGTLQTWSADERMSVLTERVSSGIQCHRTKYKVDRVCLPSTPFKKTSGPGCVSMCSYLGAAGSACFRFIREKCLYGTPKRD